MKCLGSLVAHGRVFADPDKIQSAQDWPLPSTSKELLSFLSFCSYMRHHVRHYADLAAPLHHLTAACTAKRRKGSSIVWSPDDIRHFELLRHAVATCPALNAPDFSKPFAVACDSSM